MFKMLEGHGVLGVVLDREILGPGLDDLSKVFDLSSYDLELERLELMERDQIQSTNVY